ncbi:MAG: putative transposase, partial [Bacteroidia bacterium]
MLWQTFLPKLASKINCNKTRIYLFPVPYAKAINKQQDRTGSLFQKYFKRIPVDNEAYYSQMIYYVHTNSRKHGIDLDFKNYPYNSYQRILQDKPSKLFKNEVIDWFGSK